MTDKEIKNLVDRARNGEFTIERQEPCAESKWIYHWAFEAEGKLIVGTGTRSGGDDYDFAQVKHIEDKALYV